MENVSGGRANSGERKFQQWFEQFLIEADSSRLLGQGSHFLYILHSRSGFQTFSPWINKSITAYRCKLSASVDLAGPPHLTESIEDVDMFKWKEKVSVSGLMTDGCFSLCLLQTPSARLVIPGLASLFHPLSIIHTTSCKVFPAGMFSKDCVYCLLFYCKI